MWSLPKEHGLTITWLNTIILSVATSSRFNLYGLILISITIPSITMYDELLSGLRLINLGKLSFLELLTKKMSSAVKIILAVIVAVLIIGVFLYSLPLSSLFFPITSILAFGISLKFLGERNMLSRIFSVLAITSQYVVLNSSISGSLSIEEMEIFVTLCSINIILVLGVGQIVSSKLYKKEFFKGFLKVNFPVLIGLLLVICLIYVKQVTQFMIFSSIFVSATVSFILFRNSPIKKIGIMSSSWNFVTSLFLIMTFYLPTWTQI